MAESVQNFKPIMKRGTGMNLLELLLIAIGLSMDAFAVSVGIGLTQTKKGWKAPLTAGLYFGLFQAIMPLLGYLVGYRFSGVIQAVDHWIAFALLSFIGGKMLVDSLRSGKEETSESSLLPGRMLILSLATSIDALAVGVSFAFLQVKILPAISFIGGVTFLCSALGCRLGHIFGSRYQKLAERAGGIILILMGLKILLSHLGILLF
jgi:putative Mn2+ efflux pump MntP